MMHGLTHGIYIFWGGSLCDFVHDEGSQRTKRTACVECKTCKTDLPWDATLLFCATCSHLVCRNCNAIHTEWHQIEKDDAKLQRTKDELKAAPIEQRAQILLDEQNKELTAAIDHLNHTNRALDESLEADHERLAWMHRKAQKEHARGVELVSDEYQRQKKHAQDEYQARHNCILAKYKDLASTSFKPSS
jgi:hypothetical protein